jgi:hypothetical protein
VVLDASLPKTLGAARMVQLEANGWLKSLELSRAYFDIEMVPLVGDFQNFWPSKSVYAQPENIKIKYQNQLLLFFHKNSLE